MRYPAGIGYVPLRPEAGQYLGKPVCHNGQVILLLVDFPKQEIQILAFDETTEQTSPLAILPLSIAEDCYNLMSEASPFMLTRSANDNKFQILWPERREFLLEDRESFLFLDGDKSRLVTGSLKRLENSCSARGTEPQSQQCRPGNIRGGIATGCIKSSFLFIHRSFPPVASLSVTGESARKGPLYPCPKGPGHTRQRNGLQRSPRRAAHHTHQTS